jgi:hypothetical protein
MPQVYPEIGEELLTYALSDTDLQAIGRLVRACAEIEDVVNLHMCALAEISEGHSVLLLGRTAVSQKLKISGVFAVARGGNAKADFDECFGQVGFADMMRCRNTVAHGVLLGITNSGQIAFRVTEPTETTAQLVALQVNAYKATDLVGFALGAEAIIPQIENRLGLQGRHETRLAQALRPHRKSRTQTTRQGSKRAPPPQS